MARDLNNKEGPIQSPTNGDADVEARASPRETRTESGLLGNVLTDAYNIGIATLIGMAAYWILFHDIPVGLFGLLFVGGTLLVFDIALTIR